MLLKKRLFFFAENSILPIGECSFKRNETVYFRLSGFKDVEWLKRRFDVENIIQQNIYNQRKNTKILVIDDQQFEIIDLIKNNGFSVDILKDISSIEMTEPYHIILCDIKGVGLMLNPEKQGIHLINEIKKTYPSKIVIAYTAGTESPMQDKLLQPDGFLLKTANLTEWIDLLDLKIKEVMNPVFSWEKIKLKLVSSSVPPIKIAELEDAFVRSIDKNDKSILENEAKKNRKKINVDIGAIIRGLGTAINIWSGLR